MENKPRYIIIHCSDVSEKTLYDQLKSIEYYHSTPPPQGHPDAPFPKSSLGYHVGYHHLITGGIDYQCRLYSDQGAHCNQHEDGVSLNFQSVGVCWAGAGDKEFPSPVHYELLRKRIWALQDQFKIPNSYVRFHRFYNKTKTCPGSLLDSYWLDSLLQRTPSPADPGECAVKVEEKDRQIFNLKELIKSIFSNFNLFKK